jgi:hypothetical protein
MKHEPTYWVAHVKLMHETRGGLELTLWNGFERDAEDLNHRWLKAEAGWRFGLWLHKMLRREVWRSSTGENSPFQRAERDMKL